MSEKHQMKRISKPANEPVRTKYSWKFWCMVIAEIATITAIILWLGLSVKAFMQDMQMLYFKNKAEGTVTVAEYKGAKHVNDSDSSIQYEHVRYVIEFDNSNSGYSQYEYHADNMISSRKYEGQRFLVLFNEIDNPTLIRKDAIAADNFFLISFAAFCITAVIFRKNIWLWIKKISKELDDCI